MDKNESPLYHREFFFFNVRENTTNHTKFLPLHFVKFASLTSLMKDNWLSLTVKLKEILFN